MFGRSLLRTASAVLSSSGSGLQTGAVQVARRCIVNVGDKVPITFIKDEPAPVIKANSEYPEWVFQLGIKGPTKAQLLEKFGENGEGLESMTVAEKRRLKRLITLGTIKENNSATLTEQ